MPEQGVKPEFTQSQKELEARDKRRLETFIDGVFAIAITLLGLEFAVPLVQHSNEILLASFVGIAQIHRLFPGICLVGHPTQ